MDEKLWLYVRVPLVAFLDGATPLVCKHDGDDIGGVVVARFRTKAKEYELRAGLGKLDIQPAPIVPRFVFLDSETARVDREPGAFWKDDHLWQQLGPGSVPSMLRCLDDWWQKDPEQLRASMERLTDESVLFKVCMGFRETFTEVGALFDGSCGFEWRHSSRVASNTPVVLPDSAELVARFKAVLKSLHFGRKRSGTGEEEDGWITFRIVGLEEEEDFCFSIASSVLEEGRHCPLHVLRDAFIQAEACRSALAHAAFTASSIPRPEDVMTLDLRPAEGCAATLQHILVPRAHVGGSLLAGFLAAMTSGSLPLLHFVNGQRRTQLTAEDFHAWRSLVVVTQRLLLGSEAAISTTTSLAAHYIDVVYVDGVKHELCESLLHVPVLLDAGLPSAQRKRVRPGFSATTTPRHDLQVVIRFVARALKKAKSNENKSGQKYQKRTRSSSWAASKGPLLLSPCTIAMIEQYLR